MVPRSCTRHTSEETVSDQPDQHCGRQPGRSVIVAGNTSSTNFPVANAYQATAVANQGGMYGNYGFLTKFSPDGSSLVYSTYLGGNSNVAYNCGGTPCWPSPYNAVTGVALDNSGNAYVTGITNTYNFPDDAGRVPDDELHTAKQHRGICQQVQQLRKP